MLTVEELDGFRVNDEVVFTEVYFPYDQEIVGRSGKIEIIAATNKLDRRIAVRIDGVDRLVWCNSTWIEKGKTSK